MQLAPTLLSIAVVLMAVAAWIVIKIAFRLHSSPFVPVRGTLLPDGPELHPSSMIDRLHALDQWARDEGMTDLGWAALGLSKGVRANVRFYRAADGTATMCVQFFVIEVQGQLRSPGKVVLDLTSQTREGAYLMTTTLPRPEAQTSDLMLYLPRCQDLESFRRVHLARMDRAGRERFVPRPETLDALLDQTLEYQWRLHDEACAKGTMRRSDDGYAYTWTSILPAMLLLVPFARVFSTRRLVATDRAELRDLGLSELWSTG